MPDPNGECMAGCTANVVLLTKNELYCANSGDSRAVIKTGNVLIL